jgi:hypothetical protein
MRVEGRDATGSRGRAPELGNAEFPLEGGDGHQGIPRDLEKEIVALVVFSDSLHCRK